MSAGAVPASALLARPIRAGARNRSAAGDTFRQPLALVVIGGLITSTFLTLLLVLVAYAILDIVLMRLGNLRTRKVPQPQPAPNPEGGFRGASTGE